MKMILARAIFVLALLQASYSYIVKGKDGAVLHVETWDQKYAYYAGIVENGIFVSKGDGLKEEWEIRANPTESKERPFVFELDVLEGGFSIVVGSFSGKMTFCDDIHIESQTKEGIPNLRSYFVLKVDNDGKCMWATEFSFSYAGDSSVPSVCLFSDGKNIQVSSSFSGYFSMNKEDIYNQMHLSTAFPFLLTLSSEDGKMVLFDEDFYNIKSAGEEDEDDHDHDHGGNDEDNEEFNCQETSCEISDDDVTLHLNYTQNEKSYELYFQETKYQILCSFGSFFVDGSKCSTTQKRSGDDLWTYLPTGIQAFYSTGTDSLEYVTLIVTSQILFEEKYEFSIMMLQKEVTKKRFRNKWSKSFGTGSSPPSASLFVYENEIYFTGAFNGEVKLSEPEVVLSSSKESIFFGKVGFDGKIEWIKQVDGVGDLNFEISPVAPITGLCTKDSCELYFAAPSTSETKIGGTTIDQTTTHLSFVTSFSSSGTVKWIKEIFHEGKFGTVNGLSIIGEDLFAGGQLEGKVRFFFGESEETTSKAGYITRLILVDEEESSAEQNNWVVYYGIAASVFGLSACFAMWKLKSRKRTNGNGYSRVEIYEMT